MNKEQIDLLRKIAETAGLLSQQFSDFANSFQMRTDSLAIKGEVSKTEVGNYALEYYGAPSGNGFEDNSQLPSSSSKCLYVIQKTSENTARFYPIVEKISRFKMNTNSLFYPVCTAVGDISESSSMEFTEGDYGELEFSNGYWEVTKKCTVFFS